MLAGLRRYSRSTIIYLLFGIIIVVFIFTFNTSPSGRCSGGPLDYEVAEVNGEALMWSDLNMAMQLSVDPPSDPSVPDFTYTRTRYSRFDPYGPEPEQVPPLKTEKVMNELIETFLVSDIARSYGLDVSDEELSDAIAKRMGFKDGQFDEERYRNFVRYGLKTAMHRYEEFERRELLRDRFADLLARQAIVDPKEVDRYFEDMYDQVSLRYVLLTPEVVGPHVAVNDADVSKWLADHEADAKKYYDDHPAEFHKPERVVLRGIFRKAPFKALIDRIDDEDKKAELISKRDEARTKALELHDELAAALEEAGSSEPAQGDAPAQGDEEKASDGSAAKAGTNSDQGSDGAASTATNPIAALRGAFTKLAPDNSEHDASASEGGLLGPKSRKELSVYPFGKALADAAFSLEPGQLSDVIEVDGGFWVITVDEKLPAEDKSFDEVKLDIARRLLRQERAKNEIKGLAEDLLAAARKDPKRPLDEVLGEWLERKGWPKDAVRADVTPPFGRMAEGSIPRAQPTFGVIPGIGNVPDLVVAAFHLDEDHPVPDKAFEAKERQGWVVAQFAERSKPEGDDAKSRRDGIRHQLDAFQRTQTYRAWWRSTLKKALDNGDVEFKPEFRDLVDQEKQRRGLVPSAPRAAR